MDEFESKKYIGDEVFFFMIIIYTYWNLNEMYILQRIWVKISIKI